MFQFGASRIRRMMEKPGSGTGTRAPIAPDAKVDDAKDYSRAKHNPGGGSAKHFRPMVINNMYSNGDL